MTVGAVFTVGSFLFAAHSENQRQRSAVRARGQAEIDALAARAIGLRPTPSGTILSRVYGYNYLEGTRIFNDANSNFAGEDIEVASQTDGLRTLPDGDGRNERVNNAVTTTSRQRLFTVEFADVQEFVTGTTYYKQGQSRGYRVTNVQIINYQYRTTVLTGRFDTGIEIRERGFVNRQILKVTFNRTVIDNPTNPGWFENENRAIVGFGRLTDLVGTKNQFLLAQYVFGLGIIDIIDLDIDETDFRDKKYEGVFLGTFNRPRFVQPGSDRLINDEIAIAAEQSDKRVAVTTNGVRVAPRGDGTTSGSCFFKRSVNARAAPVYNGIPRVAIFGKGHPVLDTRNNKSVFQSRTGSKEICSILYDVMASSSMTNSRFVENLDHIDYGSFQRASIKNQSYNIPHLEMGRMLDSNINELAIPASEKHALYEFHGQLPTSLTYYEILERILTVAPGLIMFRNSAGVWRLSLPADTPPSVVPILGFDDCVERSSSLIYPDSADKINSMTVQFGNIYQDMQGDEITVSSDSQVIDDGRLLLPQEQFIQGVCFDFHAYNIARWATIISRSPVITTILKPENVFIEPGDIINVNEILGLDDFTCRVETGLLRPDGTNEITARLHNYSDWGYAPLPSG